MNIDEGVQHYIDAIPAKHRPLFERVHDAIVASCPGVEVALSYGMPTYSSGGRRLHVGAWKRGISVYGWQADRDGGFTARHPALVTGRGTIRLSEQDAAGIDDEELRSLARAALGTPGAAG